MTQFYSTPREVTSRQNMRYAHAVFTLALNGKIRLNCRLDVCCARTRNDGDKIACAFLASWPVSVPRRSTFRFQNRRQCLLPLIYVHDGGMNAYQGGSENSRKNT